MDKIEHYSNLLQQIETALKAGDLAAYDALCAKAGQKTPSLERMFDLIRDVIYEEYDRRIGEGESDLERKKKHGALMSRITALQKDLDDEGCSAVYALRKARIARDFTEPQRLFAESAGIPGWLADPDRPLLIKDSRRLGPSGSMPSPQKLKAQITDLFDSSSDSECPDLFSTVIGFDNDGYLPGVQRAQRKQKFKDLEHEIDTALEALIFTADNLGDDGLLTLPVIVLREYYSLTGEENKDWTEELIRHFSYESSYERESEIRTLGDTPCFEESHGFIQLWVVLMEHCRTIPGLMPRLTRLLAQRVREEVALYIQLTGLLGDIIDGYASLDDMKAFPLPEEGDIPPDSSLSQRHEELAFYRYLAGLPKGNISVSEADILRDRKELDEFLISLNRKEEELQRIYVRYRLEKGNLKYLEDETLKKALESELEALRRESEELKSAVEEKAQALEDECNRVLDEMAGDLPFSYREPEDLMSQAADIWPGGEHELLNEFIIKDQLFLKPFVLRDILALLSSPDLARLDLFMTVHNKKKEWSRLMEKCLPAETRWKAEEERGAFMKELNHGGFGDFEREMKDSWKKLAALCEGGDQ